MTTSETITSYLSSTLSLHSTTTLLSPHTTTPTLWSTILTQSRTCPRKGPTLSSSETQHRLVELVESLLSTPPVKASTSEAKEAFEQTIYAINPTTLPRTKEEVEAWENETAFLAVLTQKRLVNGEWLAIKALRAALESPYYMEHHGHDWSRNHHGASEDEIKQKYAELEILVTVAGIWAIIMGEELWERRKGEGDRDEGGDLVMISKKKWEYWIERFQFISLWRDLRISAREVAAEAAAVMKRVV